jgi:transmembrane sensor
VKKEEAQEFLRKYCLGKCTKKELEVIDHWYHSFENDKVDMDLSNADILNNIRKQMHEKILFKIIRAEENNNQNQEKPITKMIFFNFQNLKRIAAVLLIGIGVTFFFSKENNIVNTIPINEKVLVEEIVPKEIFPSTIYLSDGSVVWLKEGSRLEYPKSFTGATREVTLIGEAFFDVAKVREKPFIIHSTHFTTRVLGTSFNIKAYESDESQEVAVVTGKVIVSVKKSTTGKVEEVVLKPSQKAIYHKKNNSLVESLSDAEEFATYSPVAKAKLAFNETSLDDIITVLNAAHDAKIVVAKENMKDCIITADLTNETLETSIAILSKAINAEYTITEKNIILNGNGCRKSK